MKRSRTKESEIIDMVQSFTGKNPFLEQGIGDDGAIVKIGHGGKRIVITTDMLIEGTHFSLDWISYFELGQKAYQVNASDLAAMGSKPYMALISIGTGKDADLRDVREFYRGFTRSSARDNCILAGGDTVRAFRLSISITLTGIYERGARALLRSGAKPGHRVYITGYPGESGMGLFLLQNAASRYSGLKRHPLVKRHLIPEARLKEGILLSKSVSTGGVIDISDGVFNDAKHIARMSKVRLIIDKSRLPLSPTLKRESDHANLNPMDFVLFGGEDYELLFTSRSPLKQIRRMFQRHDISTAVHEIGRVEKGKGVVLMDERSMPVKVIDKTFQHFL